MPSSFSLPFYDALQQLFEDTVVYGDMAIQPDLSFLYSLQDWLLGTCLVIDGLQHDCIHLSCPICMTSSRFAGGTSRHATI